MFQNGMKQFEMKCKNILVNIPNQINCDVNKGDKVYQDQAARLSTGP